MNIIEINRKMLHFTQSTLNVLSFCKYSLQDQRKYKKIINNNKDIKDLKRSERCFVLGNGPSLKQINSDTLIGKDVITVNKSVCTPIFNQLKPILHVVIDRFILDDIADKIEEELQRDDSETIFILHRTAFDRFSKYRRARFVYGTRMASSPKAINWDLCNNVTTYLNVLPFAVSCGIYAGYKEIIVLGNDFSFFTARKDQHFYDLKDEKKRTETLYQDLAGCSIVLIEYRNLYARAKRDGIRIVNCTEGSLLDELPQDKLENYLEV